MNLRDLTYIVAVFEHRHFGKAADSCFVSQPTLSGQIKKLEEHLGVALFERTNKHVIPTKIGERIVAEAKMALQHTNSIHKIALDAKDPLGGHFTLGAFPTIASYLLPKFMPKLTHELPELTCILVEEKTETLRAQLKNGRLDAAFLALPILDDALAADFLFNDPFYLATPEGHPLANHQTITVSDLANHDLLLLDEGHCLRDQALDVCHRHNVNTQQDVRATSLETLRQMVKAGTGITLMPEIAMRDDDMDLHYIPFTHPPHRSIALVYRKTTPRTAVIQKIKAIFAHNSQ